MNEQLILRKHQREIIVTSSFTVFSAMMVIVSLLQDWPFYYVPLLLAEITCVWWNFGYSIKSYLFRAFVVTAFTSLNVFLYGIRAESFFAVIPTLCVEFVLLSLYDILRVMDIVVAKSLLLGLYHVAIKHSPLPVGRLEVSRATLQMMSYILLISICLYQIHRHHRDNADAINMENQLERERKILEDFIANTSHELRTPVNTVSGLCEILSQKKLPEDAHADLLDLRMVVQDMQSLVSDILDFASLEANTMVLHSRVYNITSTINDIMNMVMFDNQEKQLEVIFDCDPSIPSLLEGDEDQLRRILRNIIGNAIKYTQEGGIIVRVGYRREEYGINLIVSVKDTGIGMSAKDQEMSLRSFYQSDMGRSRKGAGLGLGLPIAASLIEKMGGFLIIRSDEGQGSEFSFAIPQRVVNEKPCIALRNPRSVSLVWYCNTSSTEPAVRDAYAEHIRHFANSLNIVSHRAGSLEECRRRASMGNTTHLVLGKEEYLQDKHYFDVLSVLKTVILITDFGDMPDVSERIHVLYKPYNSIMLAEIFNGAGSRSISPRRSESKYFTAPEAKILVVDDNLMNLKVAEGLLKKYKIRVVTATSGEEALFLIGSQDYDFIFMDHMMPGMDGVECFHRIREKAGAYYAQVPVIALTANAVAGSREMFLAEGFSELVAKPIDTAFLNEVLRRYIPAEKQLEAEVPQAADGREGEGKLSDSPETAGGEIC